MFSGTFDEGAVLLLSRLILGVVMVFYGLPKVKDLRANAKDFVQMGFKPGLFWGTLGAFVEFFGGIAIVLGYYAEIAAAFVGFEMLVGTFWKLKIKKPFTDYSYDLLLIALCLTLMYFGPGSFALVPWSFPALRWDITVIVLLLAVVHAYLPEILGERYRKWGAGG